MSHQPTSFTGQPSYDARHPVPTVVQEPAAYAPAEPPREWPTLTVRPNGDVTLTKAMLAALPHIKDRPPIDLVPPARRGRGGTWHLDTRATAPRRLPDPRKPARFSIPPPARYHFQRVRMPAGPGRGKAGAGEGPRIEAVMRLTFRLGPEVPGHPGYYALLPVWETV